MAMTIGEASAAQTILQAAVPCLQVLTRVTRLGLTRSSEIVLYDRPDLVLYGRPDHAAQSYDLGQVLGDGRMLADRSYKVLLAGLNGDRWIAAIGGDPDDR